MDRTITYLVIALKCPYPVLQAVIHSLVVREPRKWLLIACAKGDLELLVQCTSLIGDESVKWGLCITKAVTSGCLNIVEYIHTQINPKHNIWYNHALEAFEYGYLNIVEYMYTQMRDYPINWTVCTALAAACGHLNIVEYMHVITPERIDWAVCMAWAAEEGRRDMVKRISRYGVRGLIWPMNNAVRGGHIDVVKYLISLVPTREWLNDCMLTAVYSGQLHIIKYTASQGANNWNKCIEAAGRAPEETKFLILEFLNQCRENASY